MVEHLVADLQAAEDQRLISTLMIAALVLYAVLIALPFMPGIEVGVGLLMLKGAQIAPFVYLATVIGLLLAFVIGCMIPLPLLIRFFRGIGMRKASALFETIENTPTRKRLALQRARLPGWLGKLTVDYRYVSIGVLLNVPGTFAIGGGGGILMAAGLSRLFSPSYIFLTLLIATLPVPLTVWLMGTL